MPHRVGNKWKWGNIERGSKEDLRKTVYGIWMKNGSKGSFSKFWKTGRVDEAGEDGRHKFFSITDGEREVGKYGLSFYDDIRAVGIGSFEIYPEYRNRGYGTDTLKKIIGRYSGRYDLIYCFVDAGNEGAIRLYRKLGAEISGRPNAAGQHMVVFYRGEDGVMQESADSDMIERLFNEVIRDYRTMLDIDLSYMKYKISTQPVYNNGEPCFECKPEECAGDWTKLGWIRLNPDIQPVKDCYGISDMPDEDFMRAIIRHELAHEIWNVQGSDALKKKVLSMAAVDDFSTVYLKTVKKSKLAEETFCEYLAVNLDKMPSTCKEKMVFKKVPRNQLVSLLDEIETYNENERFNRMQFEKYLGSNKTIDSEEKSMYYGLFSLDGHCFALSYLNKTPGDCILIAQITCVVRGYGRDLLNNIIERSKAMWLAADPTASESLLEYYRTFGLEEVVLDHSKWADGKEEHFFLKADGKKRVQILDYLESARLKIA